MARGAFGRFDIEMPAFGRASVVKTAKMVNGLEPVRSIKISVKIIWSPIWN